MKERIKQLFSEIQTIKFPSFAEVIIAGLVIAMIVSLANSNSIWGIVIAGIIVFIFLIELRNPTL